MASRIVWKGLWRRIWFAVATLALRLRFSTGKATFVEADVQMTTNQIADVYDAPGRQPERRLLAHYRLKTRRPNAGSQGWTLFHERVFFPGAEQIVVLTCAFCGHTFVVQVLANLDPLASEATQGRPMGQPATYESDWFRFMHEGYEGTPSLYCLHCEQNGEPRVEFLARKRS